MKKCLNCGALLNDDEIFCLECGFNEFESLKNDEKNDLAAESDTTSNSNSEEENVIAIKELKLILLDDNENPLTTWTLKKLPSYTIGRISSKGSVDIDLTEYKNSQYVSRRHGKFFRKNNKWYYVDLNSTHGSELFTKNKREKLVPMEEYELNNKDFLVLSGKVKFEILL